MATIEAANTESFEIALVQLMVRNGTARAIREESGLSLRDFARSVGVNAATVHRWVRGSHHPKGERALRLGSVLTTLASLAELTPSWPTTKNGGSVTSGTPAKLGSRAADHGQEY